MRTPQQRGDYYARMLHSLTFGAVNEETGEVTESYRDLAITAGIAEAEYRAEKGEAFRGYVAECGYSAARAESQVPSNPGVREAHREHLKAAAELEARRQSLVSVKALLEHAKVERQAEIAADRATDRVGA